jgi:hypothetical protein
MTVLGNQTGTAESSGSVPLPNPTDIGNPRPNPATESITFNTNFSASRACIEIYDLTGRIVWRSAITEPGTVQWNFGDIGKVSSGVYFAVIRSEEFSDSTRFVITR